MDIVAPGTSTANGAPTVPETGDEGVVDAPEWRIYNGTPILNVFLPYAEDYFSGDDANLDGIENIQYGTAYDPLLTIIHTDGSNLEFNWNELGITGAAGLAVYGNENGVGGGLTLNGYQANNNRYYGGTIYADGALNINVTGGHDGTFTITDGAHTYGSSVTINTNGSDALISGTIQATGNSNSKNDNEGSVTITSGKDEDGNNNDADIEILGSITSAKNNNNGGVTIPSISGNEYIGWGDKPADVDGWADVISNPKDTRLPTYAEMYAHETNQYTGDDGTVNITTGGSASVLYGNMGKGSITSYGDFTITADKGVYLDSLMDLHGDLNLNSDGEIVLDFTGTGDVKYMHDNFLHRFTEENGQAISINDGKGGDFMMAVDLWQEADPNVENSTAGFDLGKYDVEGHNFKNELNALNIVGLGEGKEVRDVTHIWISDAYQLKGIQDYIASSKADAKNMLGYNFALKNNIDASILTGEDPFTSIGASTDGYFGNFDGRGFRILGLNVNSDNAGLFSKLTTTTTQDGKTLTGTVSDLRIYASNFYGGSSAGAVAGVNDGGVISGVTTLGNHVEAAGVSNEIIENTGITGAAGGIVGINKGQIKGSDASDMIVVKGGEDGKTVAAGGIAGVNAAGGVIGKELTGGELVIGDGEDADDYLVTADSAVTATGETQGMGGAIGVNLGTATLVNSTGVTNGKQGDEFVVDNIGGVVGTNSGTIENAVNATDVTADTAKGNNAGGIAGDNSGTIDSGRNAGTIEGHTNVAGMAGTNSGALMNLSNGLVASITGDTNVGGIAGTNAGDIKNDHNLVNEGKVYGNKYVGGIAGVNTETGEIENVHSDTLVLEVNETGGQYFSGIAGKNDGTITDATNDSNVTAEGAKFVGGIAGENNGDLEGELVNNGDVNGLSNVGGLAGLNTKSDLLVNVSVTNNGKITAEDGSAGGIFFENTGKIENATLINNEDVNGTGYSHTGGLFGKNSGEIVNSTLVNNAHVEGDDNTGGLFGENTGNITNSTLINNGTVEGHNNTGGLFGVNSGNATGSSLINSVSGKVTGTGDNVGGLIGHNTGTITGGRGAGANGMTLYTDKIINNGTVTGKNNIGGLFGQNDGKLTAGYNTGHVEGASNVGGIAGLNNGAIDQAFNTVMTADGNNMISGASNAGGLVGYNKGTLTNAYNTTAVKGGGNAVGTNDGTITNVYATNTDGKLIGTNNAAGKTSNVYTFAAGDGSAALISGESQLASGSYGGFDFGSVWRIYSGYTTPMLKVFLTQAHVSDDGVITAADGLNAYNHNNWLIGYDPVLGAAGVLVLYSHQIASGGAGGEFNPNWLGYDLDNNIIIDLPNYGHLHQDGWDRIKNFRERKAELYFHNGGMEYAEEM